MYIMYLCKVIICICIGKGIEMYIKYYEWFFYIKKYIWKYECFLFLFWFICDFKIIYNKDVLFI